MENNKKYKFENPGEGTKKQTFTERSCIEISAAESDLRSKTKNPMHSKLLRIP